MLYTRKSNNQIRMHFCAFWFEHLVFVLKVVEGRKCPWYLESDSQLVWIINGSWVIRLIAISISDCTTDVVKDSIVGKFGLYSFRKRGNFWLTRDINWHKCCNVPSGLWLKIIPEMRQANADTYVTESGSSCLWIDIFDVFDANSNAFLLKQALPVSLLHQTKMKIRKNFRPIFTFLPFSRLSCSW